MTNANVGSKHSTRAYEETIFILCDTCFWSATYFTKFMLPAENRCPHCQNTELSSFPILPDQSFISNYSEKSGIELQFKARRTKKQNNKYQPTNTKDYSQHTPPVTFERRKYLISMGKYFRKRQKISQLNLCEHTLCG